LGWLATIEQAGSESPGPAFLLPASKLMPTGCPPGMFFTLGMLY
jgi:hypothetical protein